VKDWLDDAESGDEKIVPTKGEQRVLIPVDGILAPALTALTLTWLHGDGHPPISARPGPACIAGALFTV
jgi:hypothetical protein